MHHEEHEGTRRMEFDEFQHQIPGIRHNNNLDCFRGELRYPVPLRDLHALRGEKYLFISS